MKLVILVAFLALVSCTTAPSLTSSGSNFTDCDGNPIAPVIDREPVLCVARAPIYPRKAQSEGVEVVCVTTFDVGVNGRVTNEVVSCQPQGIFEDAALDAKTCFRYLPRIVHGKPVEATGMSRRDTFKL